MSWHISGSVQDFIDQAGPFLRSMPVENTVPITLAESLKSRGPHIYGPEDPIFGWWTEPGGAVTGAFLQTPPHPLMLTRTPHESVPALVDALEKPLPGVNALTDDADRFAARWSERTGATLAAGRRSRLFRLDRLTPATPPPGSARVAGRADRDLLVDWIEAFHSEIGEGARQDSVTVVDDKLAHGGLTLWEVDGTPVGLAGATRPEAGMVRVVAVYTPVEHRKNGYGGAVTTTVTQAALDAGATDVVLFTDLANATSNALYQRLGYRPVEDRKVVQFG
ncbi:GNAT family N-acetyltransferase [Actinoplanes sp. NBRC 103695]|uniref:GNAT family N-acetyltransferase n=1 Tax=Actinoplanes sp. NBRC 103695 TaxID=3032202 RepID=UPI0024A29789|nr:GNAT family N-acetyltransferase [Actinoplanes sp. NBRC 103695]GLY96263.1 N-acetyltransferase [Actinoplanes sp. NBRC 103695]